MGVGGCLENGSCLEKWQLSNGSGEWGADNGELVMGVSNSSVSEFFHYRVSRNAVLSQNEYMKYIRCCSITKITFKLLLTNRS